MGFFHRFTDPELVQPLTSLFQHFLLETHVFSFATLTVKLGPPASFVATCPYDSAVRPLEHSLSNAISGSIDFLAKSVNLHEISSSKCRNHGVSWGLIWVNMYSYSCGTP